MDDVEAEHVDVERPHAVDVRGPQMNVSDPDQRVDRPVSGDDRIDRALRAAHGLSLRVSAMIRRLKSLIGPTVAVTSRVAETTR